jgi:hypothetical protein
MLQLLTAKSVTSTEKLSKMQMDPAKTKDQAAEAPQARHPKTMTSHYLNPRQLLKLLLLQELTEQANQTVAEINKTKIKIMVIKTKRPWTVEKILKQENQKTPQVPTKTQTVLKKKTVEISAIKV